MAYKKFLGGLQGDDPTIAPQFKTWFYIYKNNTVEEDYKKNIHENYFVEVKDIDRQDEFKEEDSSSTVAGNDNSDLSYVEDAKLDENVREITVPATNDSTNSKDIPDFETLKKTNAAHAEDETRLIDHQADSSKFDAVVEDRQYVEVPVIKEEISKKKTALKNDKEGAKEAKIAEAKKESLVKTTEKLEIMQAEARHLGQRQVTWSFFFVTFFRSTRRGISLRNKIILKNSYRTVRLNQYWRSGVSVKWKFNCWKKG